MNNAIKVSDLRVALCLEDVAKEVWQKHWDALGKREAETDNFWECQALAVCAACAAGTMEDGTDYRMAVEYALWPYSEE